MIFKQQKNILKKISKALAPNDILCIFAPLNNKRK